MEPMEAPQLREKAALLRRVAREWTHGDVAVKRDLLALAASLEDEAHTLEIAQPHAFDGSEDTQPQLSKRGRALLMGKVLRAESCERAKG
jgi:hypothetical protein